MTKSPPSRGFIPFPRRPRKTPVVFMLQPKNVKANTTPEDLKLWEQWMVERCGFTPSSPIISAVRSAFLGHKSALRAASWPGGGTSGSNGGWDD